MQVDPIKATLKAPGTKRLKVDYDEPPSNFALKFNLRRYILAYPCGGDPNGGRPIFPQCPAPWLRRYPFFFSSAWVGVAAVLLWGFAFRFLKIEAKVPPPPKVRRCRLTL